MQITVHCLVRNEENFIWFALQSVIPYVDKILVWDTGSTDNTVSIIKSIKSDKIAFSQKGEVDAAGVSCLRQEMLNETHSKWIMILDGDEIWWSEAMENITRQIEKNKCDLVVSPLYMLIGDVFHYQEANAGRYKIADKIGHYNIRFIKNTAGLHIEGIYPNEAYVNAEGKKIQNVDKEKMLFSSLAYLHASHLKRTNSYNAKYKLELGVPFPTDFYYPESLFLERPDIVPSPWQMLNTPQRLLAGVLTPIKKLKRAFYA